MKRRYQIFVSSTFRDLEEEREKVMRTILELGHFPSGMELFPSANDNQWSFIKKVIDECDYYIVIVAGMYGTIHSETGLSYTEMEYRYACEEAKKPVIGFLLQNIDDLPKKKTEPSVKGQKSLKKFRDFLGKRLFKYFKNSDDLGRVVATSLPDLISSYPSPGWVKSDVLHSDSSYIGNLHLANYLKKYEESFILMPFREDLVAEVTYTDLGDNNFLVRDKVSYLCRGVGENLQENLSWSIEPNEFIEVKRLTIDIKPPVGHKLSGRTYKLYDGGIDEKNCLTGFEIKTKIPNEINADGLRVTYDAEYIISTRKLNFWIMGNPTRGFTLMLTYPVNYDVQVGPFVQLTEAIDLTIDRKGYYKFKYDEWILPDDGLAWIFYKHDY